MVPYLMHEPTETGELMAADGTKLFFRCWRAEDSAGRSGAALLVHGLGEHGGRYGHVAKVLNELGFDVWAHDHRGFGKSAGARARIPERNTLLEDMKLVFENVRNRAGGGAPLLLGHSMGGAIAARAVTGGWVEPRALVLSSPGLRSLAGPVLLWSVRLAEYILPNVAVPHGLPLHKISHDDAVLAEAKQDPLNHHLLSPRLANFILDAGDSAIRNSTRVAVPVLIQAAGDDWLADVKGAREFATAAPSGLCTLKLYPALWHEIYNEREPDRSAVLADLKDWVSRAVLR